MYLLDLLTDLKPHIETALWWLLIIYLVVLIIYVLCSAFVGKALVKSFPKSKTKEFKKADLVYYLPIATLQVTATAKVLIKKQTAPPQVSPELIELTIQTTVQYVPDTANPFALQYQGSWFSSDNFKINLNSMGLIEGVNVTAEDRIANIISSISDAPKTILSKANLEQAFAPEDGITTEEKVVTTTFYISSDELKSMKADCSWKIPIDGSTPLDASFFLKFDSSTAEVGQKVEEVTTELKGIFIRPVSRTRMFVFLKKDERDKNDTKFENGIFKSELVVPDNSRVISIRINRSSFVKKTYGLKVSNGLLAENSIDKPSEVEGFISIPIAVAKAIVSIPAQLIQFRIVNIKNETTLETTQQALDKAKLDTRKNEIALEAEILKAKIEAQKATIAYDADIAKIKFDAQKGLLEAEKNLINEQKALTTARKQFEDELKKLKDGK